LTVGPNLPLDHASVPNDPLASRRLSDLLAMEIAIRRALDYSVMIVEKTSPAGIEWSWFDLAVR